MMASCASQLPVVEELWGKSKIVQLRCLSDGCGFVCDLQVGPGGDLSDLGLLLDNVWNHYVPVGNFAINSGWGHYNGIAWNCHRRVYKKRKEGTAIKVTGKQ